LASRWLGLPVGTALRCSPGRGKRLRRRGWTSRSRRWRRLALGGDDRDESTSAAHRPAAQLHGRRRRSCGSGGAGQGELRHAAERTCYIGARDARSPRHARLGGGGARGGCLGQRLMGLTRAGRAGADLGRAFGLDPVRRDLFFPNLFLMRNNSRKNLEIV
jgi:hypothetical protein